jgi:hypothetical protein
MSGEDSYTNYTNYNVNYKSRPITIHNFNIDNAYNIDNSSQYCKHYQDLNYDEYSLKQNFFNPNKSSPPNDWTLRLEYRLHHNNSNGNNNNGNNNNNSNSNYSYSCK